MIKFTAARRLCRNRRKIWSQLVFEDDDTVAAVASSPRRFHHFALFLVSSFSLFVSTSLSPPSLLLLRSNLLPHVLPPSLPPSFPLRFLSLSYFLSFLPFLSSFLSFFLSLHFLISLYFFFLSFFHFFFSSFSSRPSSPSLTFLKRKEERKSFSLLFFFSICRYIILFPYLLLPFSSFSWLLFSPFFYFFSIPLLFPFFTLPFPFPSLLFACPQFLLPLSFPLSHHSAASLLPPLRTFYLLSLFPVSLCSPSSSTVFLLVSCRLPCSSLLSTLLPSFLLLIFSPSFSSPSFSYRESRDVKWNRNRKWMITL